MMTSAAAVKKIRINLCLEQEEFANKLGISKQAISNYEHGLRSPRLSIIRKIRDLAKAGGLKFSVEDFLND